MRGHAPQLCRPDPGEVCRRQPIEATAGADNLAPKHRTLQALATGQPQQNPAPRNPAQLPQGIDRIHLR